MNRGSHLWSAWIAVLLPLMMVLLQSQAIAQCQGLDFSIQNNGNCAPSTYVFTAMGTGPGVTISWTVNGQNAGQGGVFTHVFGQGGSFSIGMTVTPSGGSPCPTVTKNINVLPPPSVSITTTPGLQQTFCGQANITLTAQCPTGISNANWFINNQNLTGQSINVSFNQSGQYLVTLQIVDNNGCTAVEQDTLVITVVRRVRGNYTVQPAQTCAPANITLGGNLNIPTGASLDSLVWNFSGGLPPIHINGPITQNTLQTQILNLTQPGNYGVSLTAYVAGCSFNIQGPDTIRLDGGTTPVIQMIQGADTVCASDQLILQNNTPNLNNYPGTFFWTAPGARPTFSNALNETFSFRDTGLFTFTLHYLSLCGDTTMAQQQVYVNGPIARFDYDTIEQRACTPPHTVIFGSDPILPTGGTNTYFWEFFDENNQPLSTSTLTYPAVTYTQPGTYRVRLTITNSLTGCSHTIQDNRMITIGTPLVQLDPTGPGPQCAPASISTNGFNLTPHLPGYTYVWKVFDSLGNLILTENGRNPTLNINTPGIYSLRLLGYNGNTCIDSVLEPGYIVVNGVNGRISTAPSGACLQGGSFTQSFTIDSLFSYPSNTNLQYEWRVRPNTGVTIIGGTSSSAQITFTEPACYRVDVRVLTGDSCETWLPRRNICVGAIADFDLEAPDVCAGGSIDLTNKSRVANGNGSTYQWYTSPAGGIFSPSASDENPSVSFSNPGTYQVGLIFTNRYGCIDTVEYPVNVFQFVGSLSASDTSIDCGPALIKVRANTPFATNYTWNLQGFQTNYTLQTQAPNDSISWYVSTGIYTVSCVAESPFGCRDSSWIRIEVGGPRPRFYPTSVISGCSPLTVAFQDTSANVDSVLFQFGDGTPVMTLANYPVGGSFSHTYNFPYASSNADSVVYEPTLVVMSDDCPSPVSLRQRVVVYPTPRIAYSIPATEGCAPFAFQLIDQSTHTGTGAWYILDYGDGNRDSLSSPTFNHTYQTPGQYILNYRIIPSNGCDIDSILTDTIEVFALPQASFTVSNDTACFQGNLITFSSNSNPLNSGGIAGYQWYFGDPSTVMDTSSSPSPTWSYGATGTFDVSLVVTSVHGCTDSIHIPGAVTILDTTPPDNNDLIVVSINGSDVMAQWNPSTSAKFGGYNLYRQGVLGTQLVLSESDRTITSGTDPSGQALFGPVFYHLGVIDRCSGIEVPGTSHRTVFLQGISPNEGEINIFWTPYVGWNGVREYRILLSSDDDPQPQIVQTVSGNDTSTSIQGLCNQLYHVVVVAVHPSDPSIQSFSNQISISPEYKFPNQGPVMKWVTVLNDREIEVNWEPSNFARTSGYIIDRKEGDGPWQANYAYSVQPPFIDQQVDVDALQYSYRVRMQDECGNVSDTSRRGRSILTTVTSDETQGMIIEWTPYVHWPEGVEEYSIFKVYPDGTREFLGVSPSHNLQWVDQTTPGNGNGEACYQVIAKRAFSSDQSTSNLACATFPQRLYVPNAFSPNNDGLNDVFTLVGISFKSFSFRVYDRWGNIVYETDSPEVNWDGTDRNGQDLPVGTYAYRLVARGTERGYIEQEGTITLLR